MKEFYYLRVPGKNEACLTVHTVEMEELKPHSELNRSMAKPLLIDF